MKSLISILFVAFVFATVGLLAAQENQTPASSNAAPAAASPTVAVNSGVVTEASATNGGQQLVTNPPVPGKSSERDRADSANTPVLEGNPNASQNLIEYGGPG